jgi:hypothetical protein
MFLEPLQGSCGPAPFRMMAANGDDDIIGKAMIIHGLVGSLGRLAANAVKDPIHLSQVDIGCQWARRSPLRDTHLAPGFQDLFDEVEHGRILDAPGDLLQEKVVPDGVEVAG